MTSPTYDDRRRAILGMVSECIEGLLELQDLLEVKKGHGLPLEPDWMVREGALYGRRNGYRHGYGDGYGNGNDWGDGDGYGNGYGYGNDWGDGYGYGSGYGWGVED